VIVVGTSQVRNVGGALHKRGVHTVCYTNPGCVISNISERITNMVPRNFEGKLILQIAGNDCSEHQAISVMDNYEVLLTKIKSHIPKCQIFLCEIPPRYRNRYTQFKIQQVNDFLHHTAIFSNDMHFISCPDYILDKHFKRDAIHLNNIGFELYVNNLYDTIQDFLHVFQDKTQL
jgi:hypothetical protein